MTFYLIRTSFYHLSITALLLLSFLQTSLAEVITDGSLGSAVNLTGPAFEIPADLGQQIDQRLFHSFSRFSLANGESANFSGADNIQAIFARVTGGEASNINGLLSSSIPNADLYLLNPAGIVFHENARLDLQGSFYASTADVLHFADGTRFYADTTQAMPLLSVAPVTQFGFLSDTPVAIQVQNSLLEVSDGKTLALIGGDIQLSGEFLLDADGQAILTQSLPAHPFFPAYTPESNTRLNAPSGHIMLLSLGQAGVLPLDATNNLDLSLQGGEINLNRFYLDSSGVSGGNISLFGRNISQVESYLLAVALQEGIGGEIAITADNLLLQGEQLHSGIYASVFEDAHTAGRLTILAHQMLAQGGAMISTDSFSPNNPAGIIDIQVTGRVSLSAELNDNLILNAISTTFINTREIELPAEFQQGYLSIHAGQLYLSGGFAIGSTTFGVHDSSDVIITIDDEFVIDGFMDVALGLGSEFILNSAILANSYAGSTAFPATQNRGKAGNIIIQANDLIIKNRGAIAGNTIAGDAGSIQIKAERLYIEEGGILTTATRGTGRGGDIDIVVSDEIRVTDFAARYPLTSRIDANSVGMQANMGDAGNIHIQANKIYVAGKGTIIANTENAAGGNIDLDVCTWVYLNQGGEITTSVQGGSLNGGNIDISQPLFVIANQGAIKAQAEAGNGGDIAIATKHLLSSANTVISASSRLGIDGNIEIDTPDEALSSSFLVLSSDFSKNNQLSLTQCEVQKLDDISQFFIKLDYPGKLRGIEDFQE